MFTKDIHRISSANTVMEAGDASGNSLACAMVVECIVALVYFRVRNRSSVDNRFIVSKHKRWTINGNSQVA